MWVQFRFVPCPAENSEASSAARAAGITATNRATQKFQKDMGWSGFYGAARRQDLITVLLQILDRLRRPCPVFPTMRTNSKPLAHNNVLLA